MKRTPKRTAIVVWSACAAFTVAYASNNERNINSNAYYLYTAAFKVSEDGVVAVPSRFKWSVETSWRGADARGKVLPDDRVMMRLYDPDENFTALTAQMELETAERLQRDLADIIAKKRRDPGFQHRPQLYDSTLIPIGRLKGVDENGQAIIDLEPTRAK